MKNNYIKLNNNNNHLSLGNLFNIIKKISKNKASAIQTEIFCILFNIETISETTVGNYCTGYRRIGNEYKQIYINYLKKYQKDKSILIDTINNLISVTEGYLHNLNTIKEINNNESIKKICHSLHILAKNDIYVPNDLKKELLNLINKASYYEFVCKCLFFIILEKKQPLYLSDIATNTIEEILKNTNISVNSLKDYLTVQFKEGISLIPSLKKLAKENNPYALYELGNLEYTGRITGYPRYEESYQYHLKAANFNHPTSYWMLAHMILNKKIGSLDTDDIKLAWSYLQKAASLNNISSLNTIGLCYWNGLNPKKETNTKLAIKYFERAAEKNYIYAYNNLGRIYENEKDYQKAFTYYEKSSKEEESWACNKLGLYYYFGIHGEKDYQKAFDYFNIGSNAPITTRNPWNIYNLVNLFYLKGNSNIGIKKDIEKSISLLNTIKDFIPTNELLLYCYYELYLDNKNEELLNKINYYLSILNNNLDKNTKQKIENKLKEIHDYKINIIL